MLDSRLYRWLEACTNFLLLNGLWLAACLPVVTVYPATAAMFGVVRAWVKGTEDGLWRPFWRLFKENLRQSLWIGVLWTFLGATLVMDLYLVNQMPTGPRIALGSLLFLASVLYVFTSLYIFPVMVHYDVGWTAVLKNSLLLSVANLATTIQGLLVVVVVAVVLSFVPFLLLISGSLTAYVLYRLCNRAFQKVESVSGES